MKNKQETLTFVVLPEEDGARVDRVVARGADVSRRVARTWIATGRVKVKGRVFKILARPLKAGTQVEVVVGQEARVEHVADASHRGVEIVHLDRWVVAVNKPSGVLSETDRFGSPASVDRIVPQMLKARGERSDVWLVHRLDAVTSGVLLLARTPQAVSRLGEAFRSRSARKTYLALVAGRIRKGREVSGPIGRVEGTRHGVRSDGKPAHTRLAPLEMTPDYTLVRARPTTGRTHQIRVHLADIEHPILGDQLYGGPRYTEGSEPIPIRRAMLHALTLSVPHPKTGEDLVISSRPPIDFEKLARVCGIWPADPPWS